MLEKGGGAKDLQEFSFISICSEKNNLIIRGFVEKKMKEKLTNECGSFIADILEYRVAIDVTS